MSPNARRLASIFAAALLLGAGGNLLFGASPAEVKPVAAAELPWQPVAMRLPDLATADGVWEARAPWGAAPKPVEPPPAPPPPPPMPVGIVGTGNAREAIFLVSGAGGLRLGAGGVLPDGGRVLEVSALKVVWVDGAGERQERRMFLDPVELPAGGGSGAAAGVPMTAPGAFPGPAPGPRSANRPGFPPGPGGARPAPAAAPPQGLPTPSPVRTPSPAVAPSQSDSPSTQPDAARRPNRLPPGRS